MMNSSREVVHSAREGRRILALHAQRLQLSSLEWCTGRPLAVTWTTTTLDALWWLPRHPWLAVVLDLNLEPAIPVTPLLTWCRHLAPSVPILAFSPRAPDDRGAWREHGALVLVGPVDLAHAASFVRARLARHLRDEG